MFARLFRNLTLHTLLLLTLVPSMIALGWTSYDIYQAQQHAAYRDLLGRVRAMSQLVDQNLLSVQRNLELLAATNADMQNGQLAQLQQQLVKAKAAIPMLDVLQLNTPDGQILLSSMAAAGTRLPRSATAQRIQQVAQSGRSRIGTIIKGTVSRQYLIPIDVPVRRNGRVVYVLSAGIFCSHINQQLRSYVFPAGWISVIYDSKGTIAARTLQAERSIGNKVAPVLLAWLQGPAERIGQGRTLEGRQSVAAMHRSTLTGYSVTASVPDAVLLAPLRADLITNIAIVLGSLLFGVVLAWRFAASIRTALRELQQAASAVASGQSHTRLAATGSAELVQLGEQFNTMLQALEQAKAIQQQYQQELEFAASHDALTGLANRYLLRDHIELALGSIARTQLHTAICMVDLDRFKVINDTLTHGAGDALLIEIANRLRQQVRASDTVGRLGGDEFMIVVPELASEQDAAHIANKILQAVRQPVVVLGHEYTITASVGIAMAPRDGMLAAELIMNADVAMYRAKESGGNRYQFFANEMNTRMQQRLALEAGLRQALDADQFELYYQPRCDAQSGAIVGAEALIRWRHPHDGLISPARFIPVAEETGLINAIGEWVLQTACRDAVRWQQLGHGPVVVGVNVSSRQFQVGNLAELVAMQLQASGLPAHLLELELTESAVMLDPEQTLVLLKEIKRVGVRIALDDFGTGYSSLGYLKRFPVDCLKIDQSFIRDLTVDPDDAAIARMVITLGHSLKQEVVAEGVETRAQLEFLKTQDCDWIQGYIFSPPVPVQEFEAMLREGRQL